MTIFSHLESMALKNSSSFRGHIYICIYIYTYICVHIYTICIKWNTYVFFVWEKPLGSARTIFSLSKPQQKKSHGCCFPVLIINWILYEPRVPWGDLLTFSLRFFLRKVFGRMKPDVSCIWRGCLERANKIKQLGSFDRVFDVGCELITKKGNWSKRLYPIHFVSVVVGVWKSWLCMFIFCWKDHVPLSHPQPPTNHLAF